MDWMLGEGNGVIKFLSVLIGSSGWIKKIEVSREEQLSGRYLVETQMHMSSV